MVINEAFVEKRTTFAVWGAGCVAISPRRQSTSKPEADRDSERIVPSSPVDWLVMRRTPSMGS